MGRARLFEVIDRTGNACFFADMTSLIAACKLADMKQVAGTARRYCLSFCDDWTPELLARHSLKPLG